MKNEDAGGVDKNLRPHCAGFASRCTRGPHGSRRSAKHGVRSRNQIAACGLYLSAFLSEGCNVRVKLDPAAAYGRRPLQPHQLIDRVTPTEQTICSAI